MPPMSAGQQGASHIWTCEGASDFRVMNSPAMWHCLAPFLASHSARTLSIEVGGKAMLKGNSALYRDMVVMF